MNPRLDLSPALQEIQHRLGAAQGKRYWRSLEELADTPAFQELMQREFPEQASEWPDGLSRRQFLTLMGASLALAGLSGCSVRPASPGTIVPYVRAPEEVVPGKPLFYATSMTLSGSAVGMLVESHLGRPTKIEGNPDHPASRGGTDVFGQAAVLGMYDPDRSQTVTHLGETTTWDVAFAEVRAPGGPSVGSALRELHDNRGEGLRILTETVVSPTLAHQLHQLLGKGYFPEARWHQFEPVHGDAVRQGARLAFGKALSTHYDFRHAKRVLSLGADFLSCGPGNLRYLADFMAGRRVSGTADPKRAAMNRLYVLETAVSTTGAKADHRLALPAAQIEGIARAVVRAVAGKLGGSQGADLKKAVAARMDQDETLPAAQARWVDALADDLTQADHRGHSIVLAGDRQPPAVHLLAHVLNHFLGNVGQKKPRDGRLENDEQKTVFYTDPVEARPEDQVESLHRLVSDMDAGKVKMLLILGGNPVYTAPADFRFEQRLRKVPLRVHLSLYQDETSRLCHWHLPAAHFLESWSDTRAYDGTASIVQPLIKPLYDGWSAHEVLARMISLAERDRETRTPGTARAHPGEEAVRSTWRIYWGKTAAKQPFTDFWQEALHDGFIKGTELPTHAAALADGWEQHLQPAAEGPARGLELVFQPDPAIYDGRFANNGWLQELSKPLTELTWDNAALMSPATARELGVADTKTYRHGGEHGGTYTQVVELRLPAHKGLPERTVKAPVWIMPGHADHSVTVTLGYGRTAAGKVGNGVGFNAYALRTSDQPWLASGLKVSATGDQHLMACTQQHYLMENRELVRSATLAHYHRDPRFAAEPEARRTRELTTVARKPLNMYEGEQPYQTKDQRWGMVIDLTACTGCKACVVACQAENNIPVVGKDQVTRGREMHWLRIDRYFVSNGAAAEVPDEYYFQPVPCMHCENAPCEYVCPVEATVHSAEGLNDMVYNRCVGTRFCSNNCPYKVRRFNFLFYADYATQSVRLQYNPDVTVRSRGVMEKCSYCVQRIRHAEINAERADRPIRDGEILTACQAACPAGAIVFGDLSDPKSRVAQLHGSPLNYALLADENTRPRTTYLAAVRNPNPRIETA